MPTTESNIIIYNSIDGKASVELYAMDDKISAYNYTIKPNNHINLHLQ